jgi:hypothetical protein
MSPQAPVAPQQPAVANPLANMIGALITAMIYILIIVVMEMALRFTVFMIIFPFFAIVELVSHFVVLLGILSSLLVPGLVLYHFAPAVLEWIQTVLDGILLLLLLQSLLIPVVVLFKVYMQQPNSKLKSFVDKYFTNSKLAVVAVLFPTVSPASEKFLSKTWIKMLRLPLPVEDNNINNNNIEASAGNKDGANSEGSGQPVRSRLVLPSPIDEIREEDLSPRSMSEFRRLKESSGPSVANGKSLAEFMASNPSSSSSITTKSPDLKKVEKRGSSTNTLPSSSSSSSLKDAAGDAPPPGPSMSSTDRYIGKVGGHYYHKSNCKWLIFVPKKNRLYFHSLQEATSEERKPCQDCIRVKKLKPS